MGAEGEREDRSAEVLRLAPGCDPAGLRLSPAEGFLLSRIDGRTSWRMLRAVGGLSQPEVDRCLARWLDEGVLVRAGEVSMIEAVDKLGRDGLYLHGVAALSKENGALLPLLALLVEGWFFATLGAARWQRRVAVACTAAPACAALAWLAISVFSHTIRSRALGRAFSIIARF